MIVSLKKKYFLLLLFLSFQLAFSQHFNVSLNETGESTLFIFEDVIDNLSDGDEVGLFDANGLLDSDGNLGELNDVLRSEYYLNESLLLNPNFKEAKKLLNRN